MTQKQFKYFVERANYWQDILKIPFDIEYFKVESSIFRAEVKYNIPNHTASISVATFWDIEPTNEVIDVTAFHEICHLLLCTLCDLATNYYQESYVSEIEHGIVVNLENIVKVKQ